jgi:hypothetical protein
MESIRMTGRSAQGVTVISLTPGDCVASLATIEMGAQPAGGPKGGAEGKQTALAGLDDAEEPEEEEEAEEEAPKAPAKPAGKKAPARKVLRMKPKPKRR